MALSNLAYLASLNVECSLGVRYKLHILSWCPVDDSLCAEYKIVLPADQIK